jgi:hypothetical protein
MTITSQKTFFISITININKIILVCLFSLLISLLFFLSNADSKEASSISNVKCSIPSKSINTRPDPNGVPTKVEVGCQIVDIKRIVDVMQIVEANLYCTQTWNDPRLSAKSRGSSLEQCNLKLDEIWQPGLTVLNQGKFWNASEPDIRVDSEGNVLIFHRLRGDLSAHLDIKDFPFDSQVLPIKVLSLLYGTDEISLVADESTTGRFENFTIAGWKVEPEVKTKTSNQYVASLDRDFSGIDFNLTAHRESGFYIWKVMAALFLIVFMAWTVFWINPLELGPRIGIATAAILTLIAFRFSLAQTLPKVPYLTILDKIVLLSTVLVFLALVETVLTGVLAREGGTNLANKINLRFRWIYPVFMMLIAIIVFL